MGLFRWFLPASLVCTTAAVAGSPQAEGCDGDLT